MLSGLSIIQYNAAVSRLDWMLDEQNTEIVGLAEPRLALESQQSEEKPNLSCLAMAFYVKIHTPVQNTNQANFKDLAKSSLVVASISRAP